MSKQTAAPPRSPKQAARRRGALDRHLDPELFKAFADPTRARLLSCLARCARACTVTEVAACCAVDYSVVSRHLAALARAGVVDCERQGREVLYGVRVHDVASRLRALAEALEACCPGDAACCSDGGCCERC